MANDFSNDSDCVASWKMESGALTTDSIGANTLTNNNTVIANTSEYQEGSASADFERSSFQYLDITDTNLDSGFPFKSSGGGSNMTVCFWAKLESNGSNQTFCAKYNSTDNTRSWRLELEGSDNKVYLRIGYNNGNNNELSTGFGTALSTETWYHIAVTLDSSKNYRIRIYDATAGSLLDSDVTGTFTNDVAITTADFLIGAVGAGTTPTNYFDGEIDELVVFKRILTTTEIDAIRSGLYSASSTYQVTATDGFSIGDSGNNNAKFQVTAIDGISLGSNNQNIAALLSNAIDGVSFNDTININVNMVIEISDGFQISDQNSNIATLTASATDSMTFSDSLIVTALLSAIASDGIEFGGISISEIIAHLLAEVIDGFTFSDNAGSIGSFIATAIDGISISDLSSVIVSFQKIGVDRIILSDSANSNNNIITSATDGITLSDSTIASLKMIAAVADSIKMSDITQTKISFKVTCSDIANFNATISGIMAFAAHCADIFKLGDVSAIITAKGEITISFSSSRLGITFEAKKPTIYFSN